MLVWFDMLIGSVVYMLCVWVVMWLMCVLKEWWFEYKLCCSVVKLGCGKVID